MNLYVTGLSSDHELIKNMWGDFYPVNYDWMEEGKKNRADVRRAIEKAWRIIFIIPSQEALDSTEVTVEGELATAVSTSKIMVWLGENVTYNEDDHWLNDYPVYIYRDWSVLVRSFKHSNFAIERFGLGLN